MTVKTFQIQCGDIDGYAIAKTPGVAFRRLVKVMRDDEGFGVLAAFREVQPMVRKPKPITDWFYQETGALLTSP